MKTKHVLIGALVLCLILLAVWLLDGEWFTPDPTPHRTLPTTDPAAPPSAHTAADSPAEQSQQAEVASGDAAQTEPAVVHDIGDDFTAFDIVTGELVPANISSVEVADEEYTAIVAVHAGYASTIVFLDGDGQVCELAEGLDRRNMILRATQALGLPNHDWLLPDIGLIVYQESTVSVPMYPLVEIRWRVVPGIDTVPQRVRGLRVQTSGLATGHRVTIQGSFEPDDDDSFAGRGLWLPGLDVSSVQVFADPSDTQWVVSDSQLACQGGAYFLLVQLSAPIHYRVRVLSPVGEPIQQAGVGLYFHDPVDGQPPASFPDYSPAALSPANTDQTGQVEFLLPRNWRQSSVLSRPGLRLVIYCAAHPFGFVMQEASPDQYEHTVFLESRPATVILRFVPDGAWEEHTAEYTVRASSSCSVGYAGNGRRFDERAGTFPIEDRVEYSTTFGSRFECVIEIAGAVTTPREVSAQVTEENLEFTIRVCRSARLLLHMSLESGSNLRTPTRYWHTWDNDATLALSGAPASEAANRQRYPPQVEGDTVAYEASRPGEYSGIVWALTVGPEGAVRGESIRVMGAWRCRIEPDDIGSAVHLSVALSRSDELVHVQCTHGGVPLTQSVAGWNATPIREALSRNPSMRFGGGIDFCIDMADGLLTHTDPDGRVEVPRFVLENIPPQSWVAWHPREGYLQGVSPRGFQMEFGRPPGFASLQLEVVHTEGLQGEDAPVFHWRLYASDHPYLALPIHTDDDGLARINSLPPGTYTVHLFRLLRGNLPSWIARVNPLELGIFGSDAAWIPTRVRAEVTLAAGESRILRLDWIE